MPVIPRLKDIKKKHNNPKQSAKYYNSKAWKTLRNLYIREHPLCEMCLKEGKTTPAEEIHHVRNFLSGQTARERWALLTDKNNLMALCSEHHKIIHGKKVYDL